MFCVCPKNIYNPKQFILLQFWSFLIDLLRTSPSTALMEKQVSTFSWSLFPTLHLSLLLWGWTLNKVKGKSIFDFGEHWISMFTKKQRSTPIISGRIPMYSLWMSYVLMDVALCNLIPPRYFELKLLLMIVLELLSQVMTDLRAFCHIIRLSSSAIKH